MNVFVRNYMTNVKSLRERFKQSRTRYKDWVKIRKIIGRNILSVSWKKLNFMFRKWFSWRNSLRKSTRSFIGRLRNFKSMIRNCLLRFKINSKISRKRLRIWWSRNNTLIWIWSTLKVKMNLLKNNWTNRRVT